MEQVIGQQKIGGQARAMVVTNGIQRAIQYFFAFSEYLLEIKSPYKAIVAFSGEPEYKGEKVTEAKLNGFPSNDIADRIQEDPYRFLICANKFQTGYDEPLLHTMYVDKALSGIMAVQTLSRLNRAHPKKHDVFVLDFQNNFETIEKAFADYYRTTILSRETDPNKLHTLKNELDGYQVYAPEQIDALVELYLGGADRDKLDPILDANAEIEPVPSSGGGHKPQPELDHLSNIVKAFNDQFGGLFTDAMRMEKRITDEIPKKVAADQAYQNARKNSDRQNARIEHDKALKRVITALFTDDAQLFKQFQDNESFRHWLTDTVFGMTYDD